MTLSRKDIANLGIDIEDYADDYIQHKESDLYILEDKIYKVFDNSIAFKRENICKYISELESDYFKIDELCYDEENFYGYSMPFYSGYDTLHNIIYSDMSLEQRKQICYQLINVYKEMLYKHNLTYYDWHSNNVLVNDDVKILDIDSAIKNASYKNNAISRKYLLLLILQVLNQFDENMLVGTLKDEINIIEMLSKNIDVSLCDQIALEFDDMNYEIKNYSDALVSNNLNKIKNLKKII